MYLYHYTTIYFNNNMCHKSTFYAATSTQKHKLSLDNVAMKTK